MTRPRTLSDLLQLRVIWNRLLLKGSPRRFKAKMIEALAERERRMDRLRQVGINASAENLYSKPDALNKDEEHG